jgi:hypothetical protein
MKQKQPLPVRKSIEKVWCGVVGFVYEAVDLCRGVADGLRVRPWCPVMSQTDYLVVLYGCALTYPFRKKSTLPPPPRSHTLPPAVRPTWRWESQLVLAQVHMPLKGQPTFQPVSESNLENQSIYSEKTPY